MKKLLSLGSLLLFGLIASPNSASAASVALDNSSFYTTATWTNGSNQGVGFAPWVFDGGNGTGGGFGTFVGNTGLSPSSFGIFSFPADSGAFAGVTRAFTGGPLVAGQTFSFTLGYTGIAANGSVGFDLRSSTGVSLFSVTTNGVGDWQLNDGGSNFNSGAAAAANTPFVFSFTYNGGNTYSYTLGAGSGTGFIAANNLTDISQIRLFSFQQGGGENLGFDNLAVVPEPSTWVMVAGGLGMLTLLRRRPGLRDSVDFKKRAARRKLRGLFVFPGRERAGEGNRTLVCSLGSCRSTIELHPRNERTLRSAADRRNYCQEITSSSLRAGLLFAAGPLDRYLTSPSFPEGPRNHAAAYVVGKAGVFSVGIWNDVDYRRSCPFESR